MRIKKVIAREILDSRGNPTVEADVILEDMSIGRASVPSGASTGIHEALELRDSTSKRYGGKGVLHAVKNVNEIIAEALRGQNVAEQKEIDTILIEADGTVDKSKLGANATLAVSIAGAKAAAMTQKVPLRNWLNMISGTNNTPDFPIPMFNILNGGAHAGNQIAIQEFIVVPQGIKGIDEQIEAGVAINKALKKILQEENLDIAVGDEGGYAPSPERQLNDDEDAIEFIVQAIKDADYIPGKEVMLALDVAISQYYKGKEYRLPHQRKGMIKGPSTKIISYFEGLIVKYPFISIEDPLHEDDWEGWQAMSSTLMAHNVLCVGDDITVTNPKRLQKAINMSALSGIIIKPNQVGTLTEVFEVLKLCEENMIVPIISHRSGDTADPFIADLAYGVGAQYLKAGAPVRAERVEKYNELLRIKSEV